MNKTLTYLATAVILGAIHANAATTFTADFNDGMVPPNTALYNGSNPMLPGPSVASTGGVGDSGVLKLTEAVNGQQGSWVIEDFTGGAGVPRFVARWKARVGGGTQPPADGYSFCFGADLPNASWGEEGAGTGIIVSFDTYVNAPAETNRHVEVKFGGVVVAHREFDVSSGANFVDVTVTLCSNGRVTVQYGAVTVIERAATGYTPVVGRFGFGGRTGGSTDNHWIDDVVIEIPDDAAIAITNQPAPTLTVNEGQPATLSIGVNGICYNTAQWFSNGVAIPDANLLTYTTPPANLEMNGAVYRAEVTDSFGTVVSDNSTLTVVAAPTVLGASSRGNPNGVFVFLNKNVTAATGLATANYEILSGGITVTGAVFNTVVATNGERSVVLIQTTPAFAGGQTYTVRVSNVRDDDNNLQVPSSVEVSFTHVVGTFCYDFESGLPAGTTVHGTGRVEATGGLKNSGSLKLTDPVRSQAGAFRSAELPGAVTRIRASYSVRIFNPESGNPADGYSFNVASDLPAGTYAVSEEGQGSGLTIGFDNWDGTGENAPSIDVKWAGTVIPGGHQLIAKHNFDAYIPVVIDLQSDGTLDVQVNGTNVFQNLPTPFQPISGARFGIGARTGGAVATHWYDDLCVSLFNGGPVTLTQQPTTQTNLENRPYKFQIDVDGTPPYSIQWYSNGVALAGANGVSISGVSTVDINGAEFYAVVSNEFSTVTSATATLGVLEDTVAPAVVSTSSSRSLGQITIVFSEELFAQTALDEANVSISGLTITGRYLTNNGTTLVLLTSPQTPGVSYDVNLENIYDLTVENGLGTMGPVQVPVKSWVISPGFVQVEIYKEIYGTAISALVGAGKFPNRPDQSLYQHIADWRQPQTGNPTRTQDEPWNQYGVRMSGYFIPRVSGTHRFYFTHDDEAQFRMSVDDNPANATVLVTPPGVRNIPYADIANQFVDVASLVAGQRYYFEALVKEGGGGDYLSVGVREPGNGLITNSITAIQPHFLAALADPNAAPALSITSQPANATVEVGQSATFTVGTSFSGNNLPFYQWYIDGVAVAGANGPTFVTPPAVGGPDQAITVDVHLPGVKVTSDPATLHVVADTTAPQITASVVLSSTALAIGFSEAVTVDAPGTLTDPAHYRINDAAGAVQSVEVITPSSLRLNLNGSVSGTVTVRAATALEDAAGNAIAESGDLPGFSAAFTATPVTTWADIANSAGPPTPAGTVFTVNNRDFVVTAGGADVWSGGDQFTYIYEQRTGDFDVKVRVDRLDLAVGAGNLWSKAGLNIRENLDGTGPTGSRMVWVYPTPTNGAGQFEAAIRPEPGRDVIDVNGGSYGRHGRGDSSAWVRVKRVGKSFTYYDSYDGRNWNRIGLPRVADANPENAIAGQGTVTADAINFPDTLYVGLGTVSHNQNIMTTATYFDYGDWSYQGATVAVTRNPADTVGYVGGRVKFSVAGSVNRAPDHELVVQWQRNGVDIPGAVSTYVDNYTYTTPLLTLDDDGAQYRAKLIVSGATPVFSAAATLTMLATSPSGSEEPEIAMAAGPPQLLQARRDSTDPNRVILTFNELLRPSSVNNGTYSIDQGVTVTQARRLGVRKVVLTTTGLAPLTNCVSYAISVSGVQDGSGNEMAPTDTTIPADPAARVLLITGNALGMNRSDRVIVDRLDSMGYEVTPASATAVNRRGAAAANGYSLVFISSQGGNVGGIGTAFRNVAIPVIIARRELADEFGIVPANADVGTAPAHFRLNIVQSSHPLAAGLSGIQNLVDTAQVDNRTFNWFSNVAPNAVIIARLESPTNTQAAIVGVEAGASLLNGITAASRRVATYFEDNVAQFMNNNGRALFDAMINWVSIPTIIHQPQNITIEFGSSGVLCAVAGSVTNPTYQWYRNGMLIDGATGARLVLNNATDGTAGNYTVVISNASGSVTSSVATVTVTTPPAPELDIVRDGSNIALSWTGGGTLEEATAITGPWHAAANQANPQTITVLTFGVNLDADQAGGAGRTGSGSGTVALSGNTLTINVTFSGLSGNVNNCHIHGPLPGTGVLYGLNGITTQGAPAGTISGTVTLVDGTGGVTIAEQLQQLQSGRWYINIHTTTFGGGEISGVIQPRQFFRVVRPTVIP